jgi:MFS family permease
MLMGPFFTGYGLNMGMTEELFGLLATLRAPMVLVSLLASSVEQRCGHRKYPWFILSLASRLVLAPLLLGFLVTVPPAAIVAIAVASALLGSVGGPLWLSWTWAYIPGERFGRFWAKRSMWSTLAAMPFAMAGALAVHVVPSTYQTEVFCVIFALLLAGGVIDLLFHVRIPEPPVDEPPSPSRSKIRAAMRYTPLRNTLLSATIWTFGLMLGSPFCLPYMMNELGYQADLLKAAFLSVVVLSLGSLSSLWLWGRLADRVGPRLVVVICYACWSVVPMLYFLAPVERSFPWMLGAWTVSGVFPGGAMLAITMLTVRHSGRDKTMPAALMQIVPVLGGMLGGALGTWIVAYWGTSRAAFWVSFWGRCTGAVVAFILLGIPAMQTRWRRVQGRP